jgi:hypothetical protein
MECSFRPARLRKYKVALKSGCIQCDMYTVEFGSEARALLDENYS